MHKNKAFYMHKNKAFYLANIGSYENRTRKFQETYQYFRHSNNNIIIVIAIMTVALVKIKP